MRFCDELPERLDKHLFVPMTPQQMTHHEENRELVGPHRGQVAAVSVSFPRPISGACMIALQNMRMSCDSTYLLDHETDFGVKADELATLLGEALEQPGRQGGDLQPMAAYARVAGAAA